VGSGRETKLPAYRDVKRILQAANTEDPEPEALAELRAMLRDHPDVWREGGDMARLAIDKIIGDLRGAVAVRQSLWTGVDRIREGLGYGSSPEIEKLVIEQVVLCWLRLSLLEYEYTQFRTQSMTIDQAHFLEKRLNYAQQRFIRACDALARIRKVTSQTLALQVNIAANGGQQVNILGDVQRDKLPAR